MMSLATGIELANIGTEAALISKDDWSYKADVWFMKLDFGAIFTSEDLVDAIGFPGEATNANNAVGAKIRTWSFREQIVRTGFEKAQRSRSHSRLIAVWSKNV